MADDDFGFAPPPFKAADALVQLRRSLRDLRGLTERGDGFEWRGLPALTVALAAGPTGGPDALVVRRARTPSRTPAWETHRLSTSTEVRRWLDETRRALARWDDDE